MALFATNASGQVDNHPRLIPTRWTWSGSHVGPFARCSDIGAPYRRTVALILQAQSFPQKQRRRWRRLLSGRLRRPRAGSAHHVLGLHDPGVCLMLAGKSLYRGSGAARFCHLHVEAMLRSRDHPIGRINHAIRWHVSPCVAAPKRINCYSGRCVMRLRLGTCRKNSLRGCAQELPGEVDLMGHPKSNIWPIWTRCLHPNRWKRAIRLFAL